VWMTIMFLLFLILGGMLNAWMLLYVSPPMLLTYALTLWTQYCIHAGNCNSLGWLILALWFLYGMLLIGGLAVAVHYRRKSNAALKAEEDA